MKTTLATSLSLVLFFTSTPLAQRRDTVIVKSKRLALVIGNAAYKESPLLNPVNDAKDMAQLLRDLGFEVIYKQNASQTGMKSAIREFGNNIVRGDVALFYYAGHGAQVNGENYLTYLITDSEFIVIELNAKNLNQKGRKRYTLATIDVLDRQTIYKIGDIIKIHMSRH